MRVSQLLLCLQSHSSLCSVSPPFCIGPCYHETWVSVKQGRAQQGCWSRDMPVSPALMPGRGRCVLGCCCWIFLFQGTYSSRQAGIVATAVTGVGVLLAVVIFLIYCKSKGELLPMQVTVPADLVSRWDLSGEDTASPCARAPAGLRMLCGVPLVAAADGSPVLLLPQAGRTSICLQSRLRTQVGV